MWKYGYMGKKGKYSCMKKIYSGKKWCKNKEQYIIYAVHVQNVAEIKLKFKS